MKRLLLLTLASAFASAAVAQTPLTDPELDEARGGYLMAGELAFQFGAVMRTYADGALKMETQVTWTDRGPAIERLVGDALVVPTDALTILQNVQRGQVSNVLLNADSGRDLRQETEITLTLPGFAATQDGIGLSRSAQHLLDDISLGAVSGLN